MNVAAGAVPEGMPALARPPPLRVAVLPLRLLPVRVAAPRFRMPPPLPTALPLVNATGVVRVRSPAELTSAMRKGSSEARVMVAGPIISIGVVMTGNALVKPLWLEVMRYVHPDAKVRVSLAEVELARSTAATRAFSLRATGMDVAHAAGIMMIMPR